MEYVTVFDASQKWLDWWFPAIGAVFVAAGLWALVGERGPRAWFAGLFTLFGLGIGTVSIFMQLQLRAALISALRDGRATVVEGRVYDFDPMPFSGHKRECFKVQGTCFCYSDFAVTPAFNQTRSHGGPIYEGLQVRVHHVDSAIARLEVAKEQTHVPVPRDPEVRSGCGANRR